MQTYSFQDLLYRVCFLTFLYLIIFIILMQNKLSIYKRIPYFNKLLHKSMEPLHNLNIQSQYKRPLISIAPMIDVSNIFFRYFMRLITNQSTIYTQMIHYNAILKNNQKTAQILKYDQVEHPIVLQLGGSDPKLLADASKFAQNLGYDEVNLNVGCPSPKVQSGSFGACLMKQPNLVGQCLYQMQKSVKIPITIKCRLGVDQFETYQFTKNFVQNVSIKSNINHFIIHARNALLNGLSPSENRNIPPLKYQYVYRLQKDFPHLNFTINGGIKTIQQASQIINNHNVFGCMIGRTAYQNPWEFSKVDKLIYNKPSKNYSKRQILQEYGQWADKQLADNPGISRPIIIKPLLNFFIGERNNSKYKQYLSDYKLIIKYENISDHIADAIKILEENKIESLNRRKVQF